MLPKLNCSTPFDETGGAFLIATPVLVKQGELFLLLHLFRQNRGSFFICHTCFGKTRGAFSFATPVSVKQGELFHLPHLFYRNWGSLLHCRSLFVKVRPPITIAGSSLLKYDRLSPSQASTHKKTDTRKPRGLLVPICVC